MHCSYTVLILVLTSGMQVEIGNGHVSTLNILITAARSIEHLSKQHSFSPAIYISYVDDLSAVFLKLIIPLKRPWDESWSSQYHISHNGIILSPTPSAKINLLGQVCCYPLSISSISTEPNKIV
jgi:hypothetical protein